MFHQTQKGFGKLVFGVKTTSAVSRNVFGFQIFDHGPVFLHSGLANGLLFEPKLSDLACGFHRVPEVDRLCDLTSFSELVND